MSLEVDTIDLKGQYFPVPNIRPGSLIFFWTKPPSSRPYFDRVAYFFWDIFPMRSLILTGSLIFISYDLKLPRFEGFAFMI